MGHLLGPREAGEGERRGDAERGVGGGHERGDEDQRPHGARDGRGAERGRASRPGS